MPQEEKEKIIAELFGITDDHIAEIDRELRRRCTYISRWPFAVVLEDCSMAITYNELEGVQGDEAVYRLSTRPAAALQFTREGAGALTTEWNSDPARPRVMVMGHREYYRKKREQLANLQETLTAAREKQ